MKITPKATIVINVFVAITAVLSAIGEIVLAKDKMREEAENTDT